MTSAPTGSRIVRYSFAEYGERFDPAPDTLVLDVGMKTVPGVIDHHQPDAEAECATSLVAKYPRLVLDHLASAAAANAQANAMPDAAPLTIITHRLPDFDSLAAIYLSLKLLETGGIDPGLQKIADYAKLVDSAALPKTLDLSGTPYALLRAMFSGSKKSEDEINRDRLEEGLKFMRALHVLASTGGEILEDPRLFAGIDRYDRARRKVKGDYTTYLSDLGRSKPFRIELPSSGGLPSRLTVDGLLVTNPRSFLLKEWAHRDREHPPLGEGFSFIVTNFGNSHFGLGVDPTRGINLRGLGERLNLREQDKRRTAGAPDGRDWYEGNCALFDYRIIVSPQGDTILTAAEIMDEVFAFGGGRFL
jgi:hypothetical protein